MSTRTSTLMGGQQRGPRAGRKMIMSLAVVLGAISLSGLVTYATFTDSTTAGGHQITSGTVSIDLGATGASTNRLNVNASGVVAGDTIQRSVDLINDGNSDLSQVVLTTAATTSSLLDTDTTDGLKMTIDRCSVPWTEAGASPAFTYTCGGTTSSVVATRPVVGSNLSLSGLTSLTAGNTDHLRVKLELPSAAGNSFQGLTSVLSYTFDATQRAATDR